MPYRKTVIATGQIYHIINRGVAQAPIFTSTKEYQRFLDVVAYYRHATLSLSYSHYIRLSKEDREKINNHVLKRSPFLAELFAYSLMPNHFHLLVRQKLDQGIPQMMANLQNSYARYFNLRHERHGHLFQSMFKAVRMETDEQLTHVSRYIHLNPSSSFLVTIKQLVSYPWSSLPIYLENKTSSLVNTKLILKLAGGEKAYREFVFNQAEYQRELNRIKHIILEKL